MYHILDATVKLQMMKLLFFFWSFLLLGFFAQAQTLLSVDQMPYFAGCGDLKNGSAEKRNESNRKIVEFVQKNLIYPDSAKISGVDGVVIVRFVVNANGAVEDAKLLYDIGYDCGEEALRIVGAMPTWEPAMKDGQSVSVELEMPVRFDMVDGLKLSGYSLVWGDLDSDMVTKKQLKKLIRQPVHALADTGDEIDLLELNVVVVRRDKIVKEKLSDGQLNTKQKKIIKRIRSKSILELIGTVQQNGQFYYIHRSLMVK